MTQYTNIEIFPTILWKTNLDYNFDEDERELISGSLDNPKQNAYGNLQSQETYLLNNPKLLSFKKVLTVCAQEFFDYIHRPEHPFEIYITQSWTNLTKKDVSHGRHYHPNSFISGVFYYQTTDKDYCQFTDPLAGSHQLTIPTIQHERYNSRLWDIPVGNNDLLLFLSTVQHEVPKKEHPGDRISLAFNTFIKGDLGREIDLTSLKL